MNLKNAIRKRADQCVKCNACAPACPTYAKTLHEGESARGRIALMEGLACEKLPLTEALLAHLDSCLYCRACEAVCPSEVKYAETLNLTRQLIHTKKPFSKIFSLIFSSKQALNIFVFFLIFYQITGLQWFFRKIKIFNLANKLKRWDRYLPHLTIRHWKTFYPAQNSQKGTVALFTGCIQTFVEPSTITSAIRLLNAWGFDIEIPRSQACCGAFHLHGGSPDFTKLAEKNKRAFKNKDTVFFTSGCGMILKDYPSEKNFNIKDISSFLYTREKPKKLIFKTLKLTAVLHTPCSLKNILQTADPTWHLLKLIPGLQIIPLSSSTACCGAAGLNMLTQPEMADSLAHDLSNKIKEIKPDILLTSNIGCKIHLETQLQTYQKIKILHPIELLAMQLESF
ncbi:MAG: hypothetical protein A3G71_06290 [Gammaproteobacteria bacterium RIFCSPLOWO2_12_FULL_38_14]|nr:MAG: hypothetical protein A3B69_00705 [Gammaproteobacteria bacterium RIFCSPHIGHO2_02_FULL_38_33]OGT23496.1 MAG: hypothetical protein A2W47_05765 [Gammaproteobacteria bacterium RIFCSPHIGHO2_12_38_15]OGT75434.1 MAG: hypothetical protein A3G71_06290 [Gammaproteobacteria bacterium RIFCSPLOWO2_12_FULL_38_14]